MSAAEHVHNRSEKPDEHTPDERLRSLEAIRRVVRKDYLTDPHQHAMVDAAGMLCEALEADEACVAIREARRGKGPWKARLANGRVLSHHEISDLLSLTILEHVHESEEIYTTEPGGKIRIQSKSVQRHKIDHVIAVPVWGWRVGDREVERYVLGVLYADRRRAEPFTEEQQELARDLAEICSRTLNVIRQLQDMGAQSNKLQRELRELRRENERLRAQHVEHRHRLGDWATADQELAEAVVEPLLAVKDSPTLHFLITGDRGVGKRHLARAYHHSCPRSDGPFVVLDCEQYESDVLLSSMIFGGVSDTHIDLLPQEGRKGAVAKADGGTLVLAHIDHIKSMTQSRLTDFLESGGQYRPMGTLEHQHADVQVIATSIEVPTGLPEQVSGSLWHELVELHIMLPPLESRPEDMEILAPQILKDVEILLGRTPTLGFSDDAIEHLAQVKWSPRSNFHGLRRLLRYTVRRLPEDHSVIEWEDLLWPGSPIRPPSIRTVPKQRPDPKSITIDDVKRGLIEHESLAAVAEDWGLGYHTVMNVLRRADHNVTSLKEEIKQELGEEVFD